MPVYYAVVDATGDPRAAGIHLTMESAQHALQSLAPSSNEVVKPLPFSTFKEAEDFIASRVSLPAVGSIVVPVPVAAVPALPPADSTASTSSSKMRAAVASTSRQRNGKNDRKWEAKYESLKKFTEDIGDGDPNLVFDSVYHQQDLNKWLRLQRRTYREWKAGDYEDSQKLVDYQSRFFKLLELGVDLGISPPLSKWQQMADRWKKYHYPFGIGVTSADSHIPKSATAKSTATPLTADNPNPELRELYEWQLAQQREFQSITQKQGACTALVPHRYRQLLALKFPFPAATKKQERLMRVMGSSSVDENGTPLIIRQRVSRKNFNERLDEFIKFKEEHGTAMVPYTEPGGLAEWCKKIRQRIRNKREGRPNRKGEDVSDEKIKQLEDAGFSFGLRQKPKRKTPEELETIENPRKRRKYKTFDETLQEFVEWKQQHGTAMVPQSLKGLGTWVHTQRREYSKRMRGQKSCLSDERLHKLIAVGFVFDGNEARKQMKMPRDGGGEESVDGNSSEEEDTRRGQLRETAMMAHRGVTLGQSETNPLGGWF